LAVVNYGDANGHYPAAFFADANGRPIHSWRIAILPYIGQEALHSQYGFNEPWDGPNNSRLRSNMPKVFALHGEYRPGLTTTNYLVVAGSETVFPGTVGLPQKNVKDPSSSTILIVENRGASVCWMEPRDLHMDLMSYSIGSANGISSTFDDPAVAMLDTSLHRLKKSISPVTLRALITANGGEELGGTEGDWVVLPDGRQRERVQP
jgi:Protein of unknown function (DUF1559)